MQDKELHEPRAEVEKPRQENERLRKLTTDEDKVEAAPESLPASVRTEAAVIMGPSAAETTGEAARRTQKMKSTKRKKWINALASTSTPKA